MTHTLKTLAALTGLCLTFSFSANAQWTLTGNSNTVTSPESWLGTTSTAPMKDLVFKTNSSSGSNERMRILGSNGNIGIGTSGFAPLGRLDIKGSGGSYLNCLNIVDNVSVAKTSMIHTGGSFYLGMATAASGADGPTDFTRRLRLYEPTTTLTNPVIQIGDIANQNITILQNGNIGISTSTPTSRLDVKSGNIALNQGKLLLLNYPDSTEALMSGHNTFAGTGSLGPVLYGSFGGTLGTRSSTNVDYVALNWNNSGVKIPGTLAIGAAPVVPGYQLFVQQGILAEKVKVAVIGTGNWSDYVFDKEYKLKSIAELETFIKANKHLPGIPSAEEMVKNGLDVATMDAKLLGRIEELTLYIIDMNKKMKEQNERVAQLEKKVDAK